MNVNGKMTLFVKEVGKDKIKIFETSISHKDKEGNYKDTVTVRVDFSKELLTDEQKGVFKVGYAYPVEIEGFLTTRGYETKDGKHKSEVSIYVSKAKCDWANAKEVKKKEAAPVEEPALGEDGQPLPF